MPIENWFSTPIFAASLPSNILAEVQDEIEKELPNIKHAKQSSPWGDRLETTFDFNGTNDIERFNLENLKSVFYIGLSQYIEELNYQGNKLEMYESWFNFNGPNSFQYDHQHAGARVSGVYYFKASEEDGSIRFQNPNPNIHAGEFPADGTSVESVSYKPLTGRLLLFPSWLVHRVNLNQTQNERISVAVNFK